MNKGSGGLRPTAMVSLVTAFCLLGDSMLYIVLPLYWRDFGLESVWQAGALLAVNRLVRLPFNPLAVWLYANIGQRTCMALAVVTSLLTTSAYSLVSGFWPLLTARCFWGAAWSLLRLGAYFSVLQFSSASDHGRHMGTYNGIFRLGSLFGMLGGAFIAELSAPNAAGCIFAGFSLLGLPLVYKYVPAGAFKSGGRKIFGALGALFDSKLTAALIATSFFTALAYQGIFNSMLSFLTGRHEIKPDLLASFGLGAASVAGFLQALRWTWEPYLAPKIGRISDTGGKRRSLLQKNCFWAAFLFLAVSYKIDLWAWLSLVILLQLTGTGITTLTDALAADIAADGKNAPAVLSAHSLAIDFGSAVGPVVGYSLNNYGGIHAPFFMAGTCLLLIALLWRRLA
ncbi:MAG: MFS transporter [Acidaminococcales bacterium]|jgi:MFS family permease|nr:MFS transporter [Acidaminococcales bacterium]